MSLSDSELECRPALAGPGRGPGGRGRHHHCQWLNPASAWLGTIGKLPRPPPELAAAAQQPPPRLVGRLKFKFKFQRRRARLSGIMSLRSELDSTMSRARRRPLVTPGLPAPGLATQSVAAGLTSHGAALRVTDLRPLPGPGPGSGPGAVTSHGPTPGHIVTRTQSS